jgi:hypothetical protein
MSYLQNNPPLTPVQTQSSTTPDLHLHENVQIQEVKYNTATTP